MKKNQLSVRLHGKHTGTLKQTPNGKMTFRYDPPNAQSISIGMPIQEEAYKEIQCEAFFGGLLPESDAVRKAIAKRYSISYSNSFALLKAIGYDCAGAISFHKIEEPIIPKRNFLLDGKVISEKDLGERIKSLPQKPLFSDFKGLRLSLAGAHDKAAVCIIDNQVALPENGCPTTHILKPPIQGFDGIVENEYFCLRIAKKIGLPVPNVEIRKTKDLSYLLVERYDRHIKNNYVERIHQEDFCQALGVVAANKYQNEGGPGIKECFNLLSNTRQPVIDRNLLASAIVFNYLIFNMDAHGKNFSLLHINQNNIKLAPFYDIICTCVYPEITLKMAMKIGSQYNPDHVFPRHWEQLCKEINYSYPMMKKLMKTQTDLILKAAIQEKQQLIDMGENVPIIDKIIQIVEKHTEQILSYFTS